MFRVEPKFNLKDQEKIFRHKILRMLLARGRITRELIRMMAGWRYSWFNVYQQGELTPKLLRDVMKLRWLVEVESIRLAALNRTEDHLRDFLDIIRQEEETELHDLHRLAELNFHIHHQIAMASENLVFPLLINSFKQLYINLLKQFFSRGAENNKERTIDYHRQLYRAIKDSDAERAVGAMKRFLAFGEEEMDRIVRGE